jgi:hypothetical protein
MGPSMPALIVIAVRNVIAFCTRGMGPRTRFAKMRRQDSHLSCVLGSDATIRRPYTQARSLRRAQAEYKRWAQMQLYAAPIVKSHFFQLRE